MDVVVDNIQGDRELLFSREYYQKTYHFYQRGQGEWNG